MIKRKIKANKGSYLMTIPKALAELMGLEEEDEVVVEYDSVRKAMIVTSA